jgi:hypothetical protein
MAEHAGLGSPLALGGRTSSCWPLPLALGERTSSVRSTLAAVAGGGYPRWRPRRGRVGQRGRDSMVVHVTIHAGVSCPHEWTTFESSWTLLIRPVWTLVRLEQRLGTGMTHFVSSWTEMPQAHKFEDR